MASVTLRVIDGADRGRTFQELPTPLTIGREEGNSVQLNDERVSRFHVKIQEDGDRIVLTDLESTNGTRVNGESTKLWVLRAGDVVCIGRTSLLFGSREEVAQRLAALRGVDVSQGILLEDEDLIEQSTSYSLDKEIHFGDEPDARQTLHTLLPPELPPALSPGQAAQLAELLTFLHLRVRGLLCTVHENPKSEQVVLEQRQWQNLVDLQSRLAEYLRQIGEPGP